MMTELLEKVEYKELYIKDEIFYADLPDGTTTGAYSMLSLLYKLAAFAELETL